MRIFHMIPATKWSAVYIDAKQVTPLSAWMAEDDRPPDSLPLVRLPLVCWAHLEDPLGGKEHLQDETVEPYRYISGMVAVIGPDGDPQVMPASGDLFVGYLHTSQPLSTLAQDAQRVWELYTPEPELG
jgi:hypothetical protein